MRSAAAQRHIRLATRLRARHTEIERTALTRVDSIGDPDASPDPVYVEGLRAAVRTALEYGFSAVELDDDRGPPIPLALLAQARLAARTGIKLDTVLRRYLAGYSLLSHFLVEEAGRDRLFSGAELQRVLGMQAAVFDRLLAAVGDEYGRELDTRPAHPPTHEAEQVKRLLAGDLVDTDKLRYDLRGWHVAAIAHGEAGTEVVRRLAAAIDLRYLSIKQDGQPAVWAWFGDERKPDLEVLAEAVDRELLGRTLLGFGAPGAGLPGWRLSHRQAAAALVVAGRGGPNPALYSEVAILAAVLRDELSSVSLRELFLVPLQDERDGGEAAKATVRAYFEAGGNVSSAAAALGVRRHTVAQRLQRIEARLGRPLSMCNAELRTALELDGLSARDWTPSGGEADQIGRARSTWR